MAEASYLDELNVSKKRKAALTVNAQSPSPKPKGKAQPTLALNVRLSQEDHDSLLRLCSENGWSKTEAIRQAIAAFGNSNG